MTKDVLLARIREILGEKQQQLQAMLDDLNDGIANDTKSSAGDKYETARSMSQQEIDKVSVQLQEVVRQLALLPGLENSGSSGAVVRNGSLVETDSGVFFIGIPAGQIVADGKTFFCVSAAAPMAQKLIGLEPGQELELNGKRFRVVSVG
jgi:hypothetical protein